MPPLKNCPLQLLCNCHLHSSERVTVNLWRFETSFCFLSKDKKKIIMIVA
jgi:hypothetical protein